MASTFFATKISENLARTPEGFLLARGVTIARTGFQRYEVHELPQDRVEALGITGNGYVDVYRPPEQVFDPRTIASGEGKTITLFHPPDFVGPENYRDFARGHIQNVHKGSEALESGEWPLVADLLVTDVGAIQAIDNGQRELSCGYEYDLGREGNVLVQTNIIINHLAIVPNGRAGPEARINDHAAGLAANDFDYIATDEFKESEHPRGGSENPGQFTYGGGGSSSGGAKPQESPRSSEARPKSKSASSTRKVFGQQLSEPEVQTVAQILQDHYWDKKFRKPNSERLKRALYVAGVLKENGDLAPGAENPLGSEHLARLVPGPVLYEMAKPYLPPEGESVGASWLRNNQDLWKSLGYYAPTQRGFGPRDENGMDQVLLELAQYHYIDYQRAGSIVEIRRRQPQNDSECSEGVHANDDRRRFVEFDHSEVPAAKSDQQGRKQIQKGEYNMSKILDRIFGLGLQKLATDEQLDPVQFAEAARAVHRATDSEEESEESKKSKEAEDRRMKDAEEEKKKEEDRKAKDAAEMEGLKKRATDAETEVEKLKKEAEDRKAKDAEAAKGEHFKPCTMKDCSARDCRMHDALGGILEKHPEAEDADVQDLEKLLREFRAEEAQEPEHQDAEVGSEVIEPIQEDEEMVEPIQTGDAKARDSEYQWLRANAKKIADSNDKKQIAAFNARQRAYYGTSRASTGSYGSFGAAAQARGKDVKQQQYQEQQVTEMQKAMNARLGRPVGSIQKEVVN